jgi:hypothetical protein
MIRDVDETRPSTTRRPLAVAAALLLLWITSAVAVPNDRSRDLVTYFYKDPRPERLLGRTADLAGATPSWIAYPPLVGFFAVVFHAHPDWIDRLMPDRLDPRMAETIAAALRVSGQSVKDGNLRARLTTAGSDATLQAEFAGLPTRLKDIHVKTATHLDVLWGASFASGDHRYVHLIADFMARTANRSELIALDVTRTALEMMGGPKFIAELKGKYGDALAREIIFAGTALWGMASNARQHEFVDQAIAAYIADHPGSHAAKALTVARAKRRA